MISFPTSARIMVAAKPVDTGNVVELSEPAIRGLLREIAERCGYRLLNYRLELFGEASSRPPRRSPLSRDGIPQSDARGSPFQRHRAIRRKAGRL